MTEPMAPQPKVPLTPGRYAFGFTCLAIATCGVLSPISVLVALWSLRRPEPLGFVALVMSTAMVIVLTLAIYLYAAPQWAQWVP
jgi:uncharacterized membrane protein